ncbi:MAG: hypothetical protein FJ381_04430 [Verrucomicrobia bacterium]|nr:hypothetical protein [Verrucomicrobiota bacterium]
MPPFPPPPSPSALTTLAAPRSAPGMLRALLGDPADHQSGPTRLSFLREVAECEGFSFPAP